MRRLLLVVGALVACTFVAATFISQDQALVQGALEGLKFEIVPAKGGLIGGPSRLKITKKTIEHLQKLMQDGKVLEVQPDGAVKVK